MVLKICTLVLLAGLASGARLSIDVPSNQPAQVLKAPDGSTLWSLTAERGSKIVTGCYVRVPCSQAQMILYNGQKKIRVCGERKSGFLNSVSNLIFIRFVSKVGRNAGVCLYMATLPYLHLEAPQVDSSEHGTIPGKRSPSCNCGWTNKESSRIVGGEETLPNEYPFQAAILITDWADIFCGASIITPYHVLTAAHCTFPKRGQSLTVMIGHHDVRKPNAHTQTIDVARWYDHPEYSSRDNQHDISIMVLKEKIQYNDHVGPICLPNKKISLVDDVVKVMGWGFTNDKTLGGTPSLYLNKVNVRVVNPDICKTVFKIQTDNPTQICTHTNNRGPCKGDSGGPLVWLDPETNRYVQVALVSYGGEVCGSSDPTVSTDVWAYIPWIQDTIQNSKPQAICS